MNQLPINDILWAEWHDAKLERLILQADGSIDLVFAHMCTSHKLEAGKIEIWSSKVIVRLASVSKFVMVGEIGKDEYVGDGAVIDINGVEVPLLPVGEEKQIVSAWMMLAGQSGTRVDISATRATLMSLEPAHYIQDWEDDENG